MRSSIDAPDEKTDRSSINGGGRSESASTAAASGPAPRGGPGHEASAPVPSETTPLVAESISILDSAMEFLLARLNLEGYRLERRARGILVRAASVAVAGLIAILGFVLASVGGALLLAKPLDSVPAGFLIVGGAELLVGLVAALLLGRRSKRADIDRMAA